MAFSIFVTNDGATATYTVEQQINPAERKEVFSGVLIPKQTVEVVAYTTEENGDTRGTFAWYRSGSSIYIKDLYAGDTLTVE